MKKKNDLLLWLPEEIRSFSSMPEAMDKLTRYITSSGRNMKPVGSWCSVVRFMYLFADGSLCTISVVAKSTQYGYNEIPEWKYCKSIKDVDSDYISSLCYVNIVNSPEELLQKENPYGYAFANENKIMPVIILLFPKLEQLKKAGYEIADTIITKLMCSFSCETWRYQKMSITELKNVCMMFHKGTSLYDILGFPRDIAKEMKTVKDISLWNSCRKLSKRGLLDLESIRFLKETTFGERDIEMLYNIVIKGTNGKFYFTIPSLIRYLRRVDMYEAIETKEALILIEDYIRCCHALSVKPRFDMDSLKREHDVMARNARTKIEENKRIALNEKMRPACEALHKYDYKEEVFFVRGIDSFDDLLDEASQQSNCVAAYAESIAKKTSKIFVMRETAHPEKSLITIELSPTDTIRQKYLSHNRPIRSKAHSDFIDRWMKHIRTKNIA
jgi:hypothetical protein